MTLLDLLAQPLWQHGTWALVHFLWQGAAIALVYLLLRRAIEWRSASARYTLGLAALTAMALCVPVTFGWLMLAGHERGGSPDAMPLIAGEFLTQPESLPARADWLAVDLEHWAVAAQPWLAAMWLAGVAGFGLRLLVSFAGVAWLAYSARDLPADLARIAKRVARRLGLAAAGDVFLSDRVTQAAAIGFLRPLVLLPAAWATQLDAATLEAVIAHELAHVRRWDLWVNLLQRCLETLLFYHPAVWWLSGQVRAEREMCCDEMAAEASGDRAGYVAALVKVTQVQVARQGSAACAPLLGAGMGGDDMALLERVRYVLGLSPEGENGRWWPIGLAALALPAVAWVATAALGGIAFGEDRERTAEGERAQAIEGFVEQLLESETATGEKDRAILIRRVYLDLTGAPPTPAEVEAFLRDDSKNAYDRLVHRLLASSKQDRTVLAAWVFAEGEEKEGKKEKKEGARDEVKKGERPKEGARKEGEKKEGDRKEGEPKKGERKEGSDKEAAARKQAEQEKAYHDAIRLKLGDKVKERKEDDLLRAEKLKNQIEDQRRVAEAQLKAAHSKLAEQADRARSESDQSRSDVERARQRIAEVEARLREAVERAGSEAEARAIHEKASAQIQDMRAKLKAYLESGERNPKLAVPKEGGHEKELMEVIRGLQAEVARLRAEVNDLRGQRGDAKPKVDYRKTEDGRKEGGEKKPEARKEEPRKEGDKKPDVKKEEPRKEGDKKPEARKEEPRKEGDKKPEAKKEEPRKEGDKKPEGGRKEELRKEGDKKPEGRKEEPRKEKDRGERKSEGSSEKGER